MGFVFGFFLCAIFNLGIKTGFEIDRQRAMKLIESYMEDEELIHNQYLDEALNILRRWKK